MNEGPAFTNQRYYLLSTPFIVISLARNNYRLFMSELKRKWDRISDEKRQQAIDDIIYYFESERNEKIGVIAAEQLLDFFLENVGPEVYNKGISDSKATITKRVEDLQFDLDDLMDI